MQASRCRKSDQKHIMEVLYSSFSIRGFTMSACKEMVTSCPGYTSQRIIYYFYLKKSAMKRLFILLIPLFCSSLTMAQDGDAPKFAASVNPLGFVQFGPIFNAEFGLSDNLILNTHLRATPLGLLSYVVRATEDPLDELTGIGIGGGIIRLLGDGQNRPYFGFLLEYEPSYNVYASGQDWEWYRNSNTIIYAFNGGYRFNMSDGFFINLGGFFGGASDFYNWDYANPSSSWAQNDNDPREDSSLTVFGMVEVTFGFAFGSAKSLF